jgi:hypothetical protein
MFTKRLQQAVAVLSIVSNSFVYCERIRSAGVLKPLVALLTRFLDMIDDENDDEEDDEMKNVICKSTLETILNLSWIDILNSTVLLSYDGLDPVLRLLDDEDVERRECGVNLLWNLSSAPGAKDLFRARGCIEKVSALLSTSDDGNGDMLRLNVVGALCCMTH